MNFTQRMWGNHNYNWPSHYLKSASKFSSSDLIEIEKLETVQWKGKEIIKWQKIIKNCIYVTWIKQVMKGFNNIVVCSDVNNLVYE